MNLVIQIPCLNEEKTLPVALRDLPTSLPGVENIKILIIDDGSTDKTVEIANAHGVDRIVSFPVNQGLAHAFMTGLENSLDMGADIIVHTDADNQYDATCIPDLIKPILEGKADIVVGARPIGEIEHFSRIKKILQRLGSSVVRKISKTNVVDATSGFRAYNRKAALSLNIFSGFTYTLETLIQAGHSNLTVTSVPIKTNDQLRESKLFKSIPDYIRKSLFTMIYIYFIYQPFKAFTIIATPFALIGTALILRFFYYYFTAGGTGHIQSLIIAAISLILSFNLVTIGVLANLISANRRLIEDIPKKQYRIKSSTNSRLSDS